MLMLISVDDEGKSPESAVDASSVILESGSGTVHDANDPTDVDRILCFWVDK